MRGLLRHTVLAVGAREERLAMTPKPKYAIVKLYFKRVQNEFFIVKPPSTNDQRINEYLSSFSPKSNFYFIRLFVSDSLTGLVHK